MSVEKGLWRLGLSLAPRACVRVKVSDHPSLLLCMYVRTHESVSRPNRSLCILVWKRTNVCVCVRVWFLARASAEIWAASEGCLQGIG